MIFYHVRHLSHFVLQVGSSNWVHKARIHSSQIWCHFGAKLADPLSSWKIGSTPFLSWIKYSWSGLTHIVSFINLSGKWIKLCRNQISSCQHVFYYTFINYGLKTFHNLLPCTIDTNIPTVFLFSTDLGWFGKSYKSSYNLSCYNHKLNLKWSAKLTVGVNGLKLYKKQEILT